MKSLKIILIVVFVLFGLNVSAQAVYTTKTGTKYHKITCHYLKYSKKEISLERAKALGYEACKVCRPTVNNTKSTDSATKSLSVQKNKTTETKKTTATQCTGKTKAGKRCKRMTKNANGRCYQH